MAFHLPPQPPNPIVRRVDRDAANWIQSPKWDNKLLYCDTTRQLVRNFNVGEVVYRLRQPLEAIYEPPVSNRPGRFVVTQLADTVIGSGGDLESAKKDWELKVDEAIQSLLVQQDFERSVEDQKHWELMNRHFNLSEMRYSTPADVRVYGRLEKVRAHVRQVRWLDGSISRFRRDQIPAQMVAFKLGQSFEAVVKRDNRSWDAIEVSSVFPVPSLPSVSDDRAQEILDRVPSIKHRNALDF